MRSLSSGYHGDPLIVEVGRSIAHEITRETKWPVSIALPKGNGVVVRLSTAADSPMSPFHSTINMHLGLFLRAMGRAYLAWCDSGQIDTYARQAVADGSEGHLLAGDTEALCSLITSIRWKGYALRDREIEPQSSDTLAVPIFVGGVVRATLGIISRRRLSSRPAAETVVAVEVGLLTPPFTYYRSAMRCEAEVDRHVGILKEASRRITAETERLSERHEPDAVA